MESKTKNRQTRAQIAALVARAFDGMALAAGEQAVLELTDGWFNASYKIRLADGRETVLKIAPRPDVDVMAYEQNIMATEVAMMRLVRGNPAIPVPEIYFYDQSHELSDADYFFMAVVRGENLKHVQASLPPETQTAVEWQIGEIVREINRFEGVYFGYDGNPALRAATWKEAFGKIMEALLEDAARKQVTLDFAYDELRAVIDRHAPALEEITTPCLVHWDAWNPNFFVSDGRISGIIDFERALWAEPLLEAQFRDISGRDEISHSMRGYGKTSFTLAETQRRHLYSLHLALVMVVECAYRDYDTDDVFNFARQFMGQSMAWLQANQAPCEDP